jgi:secondary thiamine-phosphate synthase enzyme
MTVKTASLHLSTRGNADILDVTEQIRRTVAESGVKNGAVTVFTPSSTSALTTIEYEGGALNDLRRLFDEIIPVDQDYAHNARWDDGNGHSHIRSALLGASLSVPFVNGRLTLGTWQQIIFIDFDNRPRQREVILQIIGD